MKNNDIKITQQIFTLFKVILSYNYFTLQHKIYQPEQGVSMRSPISSITAEVFLQCFEDIYIKQLLDTKNVLQYTRYVYDFLTVCGTTRTLPHAINAHINQIHHNIKVNHIYEDNTCINVLDLSITRGHKNLEIDMIRKPTTNVTTIHFLSNHPIEHKMAAFRYHIPRMYSLPLTPEKKEKEWELIQLMSRSNNFPQNLPQ